MAADRRILAQRMPGMRHLMLMDREEALAVGVVEADAGAGRFRRVRLEIRFGPSYPARAPDVSECGGRWVPHIDRHIYASGMFCLGLPGVDLPRTDTPADFNAFLAGLKVFLHDQFIFDAVGKWPGPEWPHGHDAYARFAVETLGTRDPRQARLLGGLLQGRPPQHQERCPCRSGLPYGRCHADRVAQVRAVEFVQDVPDLTRRMVEMSYVA